MTESSAAIILNVSGQPGSELTQTKAGILAAAVSEYPTDTFLAVASHALREKPGWGVEAHFSDSPDIDALTAFLVDIFDISVAGLDFSIQDMPDKDWVTESLQGLAPVRAGRFFVYGSHDADKVPGSAISIKIDASVAFGTGHHGTTEGCLLALEEVLKDRTFDTILDLGCGTAVLAIAAAKALNKPVLATDIDSEAIQVAIENARLNSVGDLVQCETTTGFDHPVFRQTGPFDLILANILAGPLIDLAKDMARHLAPGGIAILSGLLIEQSDQVEASYHANGFRVISRLHRGEWAVLTLRAESP